MNLEFSYHSNKSYSAVADSRDNENVAEVLVAIVAFAAAIALQLYGIADAGNVAIFVAIAVAAVEEEHCNAVDIDRVAKIAAVVANDACDDAYSDADG